MSLIARVILGALIGASFTAIALGAAQIAADDNPAPTTVTTTVTTPVAPCDHPDCPPWPSLDY